MKKLFVLLPLVALLLWGCSSPNEYNMVFTSDGSYKLDYINVVEEEYVLYTVGGMVTVEIEGKTLMLEAAIIEGKITVDALMESIRDDADNGDVKYTEYPDGSVEYRYSGITVVDKNFSGLREIYFGDDTLTYYAVAG